MYVFSCQRRQQIPRSLFPTIRLITKQQQDSFKIHVPLPDFAILLAVTRSFHSIYVLVKLVLWSRGLGHFRESLAHVVAISL
jgi:hypothetical protein